jgi:hypothetical protein
MLRTLLVVLSVVSNGCWLWHRTSDEAADSASEHDAGASLQESRLPGSPVGNCVERVLSAGEKYAPVDMVWVVDSSQSMRDEQSRIRSTINQFVMDATSRSYDVRLVMITNDDIVPDPLGSDGSRYLFVQRPVRSREPLDALITSLPDYSPFLRPDAALHFVAVTDDESALPADDFRSRMDELLDRPYTFHAVASPNVDGEPCKSETPSEECIQSERPQLCGAAAIGAQYMQLASELGGEQISICIDDWREVFGPLLEAVTPVEIPCSIELQPGSATAGPAQVDLIRAASVEPLQTVPNAESCGRLHAFYIEAGEGTATLTLCPAACGATSVAGVELHVRTDCQ